MGADAVDKMLHPFHLWGQIVALCGCPRYRRLDSAGRRPELFTSLVAASELLCRVSVDSGLRRALDGGAPCRAGASM
jgi:hypothetical protein